MIQKSALNLFLCLIVTQGVRMQLLSVVSPSVSGSVSGSASLGVSNVSELFSAEWRDPGGELVLIWLSGILVVRDGTPYEGRVQYEGHSPSLTLTNLTLRDTGVYTLKAVPTDVITKDDTVTVTLEVYEPVSGVSVALPPGDVLEGRGSASLTCVTERGTRLSYTWEKDSLPLPLPPGDNTSVSLSGNRLTLVRVDRSHSGSYLCLARNPVSQDTGQANLTVYFGPDPPRIVRSFVSGCVSTDLIASQGVGGDLECVTLSVPPPDYSWLYEGQAVVGVRGSSLNLSSLTPPLSGNYTCVVTNSKTDTQTQASTLLNIVDHCLTVGGVVGIVIGSLAAVLLLVLIVVCLVKRKRKKQREKLKNRRKTVYGNKADVWTTQQSNRPQDVPSRLDFPQIDRQSDSHYSHYPRSWDGVSSNPSTLNSYQIDNQTLHSGKLSTLV